MHWFFIGIIVENQWKISKKSNIGKRDTLSNLVSQKLKIQGWKVIFVLPMLVNYVIVQHWKQRNPMLEGYMLYYQVW